MKSEVKSRRRYRGFYLIKNTECMKFLEKDLEEIIFNSDQETLNERGLRINGLMKRQLKIGNYGIADIVTFEKIYFNDYDGENKIATNPALGITIFELKKDKIGISAFLQAVGYARGIESYLNRRGIEFYIKIVLIGSDLDKSGSFAYLPDLFKKVHFYTYSYRIDGIFFNEENEYKLLEEGFNLEDDWLCE